MVSFLLTWLVGHAGMLVLAGIAVVCALSLTRTLIKGKFRAWHHLDLAQDKAATGRHDMEITADGIVDETEFGRTEHTWKAIERVVAVEDHTFVFTSAVTGFAVPRARVIEGDYENFSAALVEGFQNATPKGEA